MKKKNILIRFIQIFHLCYQKVAQKNSFDQFIHLSALGIESATDSNYAISKLSGEQKVEQNFSSSVILKPSIVYSKMIISLLIL